MSMSIQASVSSEVPGWSDLSEVQKAEFKLKAAQAAETKSKSKAPVSPADVQEWVTVGKSVGVGFGAVAEELGIDVDKLMSSDTGKIAMFLIVWNYIGEQLLGFICGILWFTVMLAGWGRYFNKIIMRPIVQYHDNGKKKEVKYEGSWSESTYDTQLFIILILVLICAAGFIMIFSG
jgi:hypothetical protein